MVKKLSSGELLREISRRYIKIQRECADCSDGPSAIQCHILNELYRTDRLTHQMLVAKIGLDKAWISRAVELLIRSGDLTRESHETDRRSNWIRLTQQGLARAKSLNEGLNKHANDLLFKIPNSAREELNGSLSLILDVLVNAEKS